jgi:hypothetical protein
MICFLLAIFLIYLLVDSISSFKAMNTLMIVTFIVYNVFILSIGTVYSLAVCYRVWFSTKMNTNFSKYLKIFLIINSVFLLYFSVCAITKIQLFEENTSLNTQTITIWITVILELQIFAMWKTTLKLIPIQTRKLSTYMSKWTRDIWR